MTTELKRKADEIEGILGNPARAEVGIENWKTETICLVESEARIAVVSLRIANILRDSPEVREVIADLKRGDFLGIQIGRATLSIRRSGITYDGLPF
jgi:hypothetical protein